MEDESRSLTLFGREIASGTTAKALSAVVRFTAQIIFARFLGPGVYGSYHLLLSIVHVVDWPISGWSDATKKRLSDNRADRNEIISALLILEVAFFVVVTFLGYLSKGIIADYVQVEKSLILLTLLLVHVMIFYPLLGILLSQERIAQAMWAETGHAVLALLFQTYLLYIGFELVGLVIGISVSTLLTAIVFRNTIPRPTIPSSDTFRSLWDYAKYSSIDKLLGKGYDRFDILLLGALIGSTSIGYYQAASVLAAPALFSSKVISSGIMPTVSRLQAEDSDIQQSVSIALRLSPILSIPVFFGSTVLSENLIMIVFGSSYQDASLLLPWIALYYVLKSISSPLSEVINGLSQPRYNAVISGGTLLINIILGIVLGLLIGTLGIVLATVVSEAIRLVYLKNIANDWDIDVFSPLHIWMIAGSVVMTLVVWVWKQLFSISSVISISLTVIGGGIVYLALLSAFSLQIRRACSDLLREYDIIG